MPSRNIHNLQPLLLQQRPPKLLKLQHITRTFQIIHPRRHIDIVRFGRKKYRRGVVDEEVNTVPIPIDVVLFYGALQEGANFILVGGLGLVRYAEGGWDVEVG
jgi:hypothetical protein